jgi:hypothetical protein
MSHGSPAIGRDARIQSILREWHQVQKRTHPLSKWNAQIQEMRAEVGRLKAYGVWRSGARTLLSELGVHYSEVALCRGMAWLLRPDGWHGLGTTMLEELLDHLGLPTDGADGATVSTEVLRHETRADIVIQFADTCVLIEAKIFAEEQSDQADRLARWWSEDASTLVFLTRDGRRPATAIESHESWRTLRWQEVARLLGVAIAKRPDCAPGARDLQQTLELHGGRA